MVFYYCPQNFSQNLGHLGPKLAQNRVLGKYFDSDSFDLSDIVSCFHVLICQVLFIYFYHFDTSLSVGPLIVDLFVMCLVLYQTCNTLAVFVWSFNCDAIVIIFRPTDSQKIYTIGNRKQRVN